ncbi:MAG: rRNA maturation RNase YbeY [bacterium]
MITINTNSHSEIDENIFLQNAIKITENIINSEILEYSPIKEYDFLHNDLEFDVMFCDNKKIHEINRDYRGKDKETDVITFALFSDSEPEMRFVSDEGVALGEIIISVEKIKSQALENKKTFEEELYFILAHGILHLFGFTHQTEEKLEYMIGLQQRLVENVKI